MGRDCGNYSGEDVQYVSWRFPSINGVYLPTTLSRFLLVSLNIEAILGEVTISGRREKLIEMA